MKPQGSEITATSSLLHTKRYALYWVSSLLSNLGTWMQQIAQPWVVLTLSNSSFLVGADSFALNAPGWIFTLWGGVIADKYDRRRIILFFQGLQLLCVVTLATLLILGWLKVWMIVIISFLVGATDAISMPSFQSIIPSLVPTDDIPRAVAFNSAQFNLSRVLGPAVAGIVIVKYGAVACYGANAVSYIPFFLSLYWIYPRGGFKVSSAEEAAEQPTRMGDFTRLLSQKQIRNPLLTVIVTTVFCSPLVTFAPVIIKSVFHAKVTNFGGAMAAYGIGGVLGAGLTFVPVPQSFGQNRVSLLAATFLAITVLGAAFNRSLIGFSILLALAGIMLTVSNVSVNSYLQKTTANPMRGRVVSLYQLALHGGMSLGSLLTGMTTSRFSISTALAINAAIALILQIVLITINESSTRVH